MIYLDYQATTPLAPEARDAMLRWLDGPGGTGFGNPHSAHRMGRQAKAAVELARDQVAALFPAGGKIVFNVPDPAATIALAVEHGGTLMREPEPNDMMGGKHIGFVTDPDGQVIELIEY